jgi:hypothetical protein
MMYISYIAILIFCFVEILGKKNQNRSKKIHSIFLAKPFRMDDRLTTTNERPEFGPLPPPTSPPPSSPPPIGLIILFFTTL